MKATVFSHSNLIGTTDLVIGDTSMGHLYGLLVPNEFYFENIQKQVWPINDSANPNYGKWNYLRLVVKLEDGFKLDPKGGITIDDIENLPNEPIRIDIGGLNGKVLNDYFRAT